MNIPHSCSFILLPVIGCGGLPADIEESVAEKIGSVEAGEILARETREKPGNDLQIAFVWARSATEWMLGEYSRTDETWRLIIVRDTGAWPPFRIYDEAPTDKDACNFLRDLQWFDRPSLDRKIDQDAWLRRIQPGGHPCLVERP